MTPVSKDIHYLDLLDLIEVDELTFTMQRETGLSSSLVTDGYTKFLALKALNSDALLQPYQCTVKTANIYTRDKKKCFYITFTRKTFSKYDVTIQRVYAHTKDTLTFNENI